MLPIVHVGYHKTATNYFQKHYFPLVNNYTYMNRFLVQELFLKRAFDFDRADARSHFEDHLPNVILSEEELLGSIHTGGLHGFHTKVVAERLKQVFPDARIVVFIRNQIGMIDSVYKQYIKEGGNYSASKYLDTVTGHVPKTPNFSYEHFNYYALINFYGNLFGKGNVQVFLFEELEEGKMLFLDKFADTLGLTFGEIKPELKYYNTSYSNGFLNFTKSINFLTREGSPKKYKLLPVLSLKSRFYKNLRVFSRIEKKINVKFNRSYRLFLPDLQVEHIRRYYRESNARLSKEYNLDLEKYNYPLA